MWNKLKRWLRKLQIQFALWLLRRNIPLVSPVKQSPSFNTLTDDSEESPLVATEGQDPCQLEVDAKIESGIQQANALAALQAATELDAQRSMALMICRMRNP